MIITDEKKGVKRSFVTLNVIQGLADQVRNDEEEKLEVKFQHCKNAVVTRTFCPNSFNILIRCFSRKICQSCIQWSK